MSTSANTQASTLVPNNDNCVIMRANAPITLSFTQQGVIGFAFQGRNWATVGVNMTMTVQSWTGATTTTMVVRNTGAAGIGNVLFVGLLQAYTTGVNTIQKVTMSPMNNNRVSIDNLQVVCTNSGKLNALHEQICDDMTSTTNVAAIVAANVTTELSADLRAVSSTIAADLGAN